MKFYSTLLLIFFLNLSTSTAQQYYPIADTAFVHFLHDSVPNCMQGDSLIIDSAHLCTKDITNIGVFSNPYYYNIYSLDGIQFFDHTHTISFSYTHITSLPHLVSDSLNNLGIGFSPIRSMPPLDSIPNLYGLGFQNDSLTALPDMSHLKHLLGLSVYWSLLDSLPSLDSLTNLFDLTILNAYKPLHHIPSLSNNKDLEYLSLDNCGLDSLPSLDSCIGLSGLGVFNNNLRKLPSLANNARLYSLYCDNNQLTQLPALNHCPDLHWLLAYSNMLDSLPDLSQNTNLSDLYVDSNRLTSLPDLSSLTNLQLLHASANMLTTLPNFSTHTVVDLDLSHNLLTEFPIPYQSNVVNWLLKDNLINTLPEYSYTDSLAVIDISENKLDFANAYGMKLIDESMTYTVPANVSLCCLCCYGYDSYPPIDYVYAPQKPFGITDTVTVDTYSDTVLTIAYQQYADSYQWYQNGIAIPGATDTLLHIYCVTQADAGTYTCHSIGQYFNTHDFRFSYNVTEFESEPQTVIVSPTVGRSRLASLYPAVSSGAVTLQYEVPEAQDVTLDIYDTKGSRVYGQDYGTQAHSDYTQQIDLSGLASGTYIAQVRFGLGYRQSVRLVILH